MKQETKLTAVIPEESHVNFIQNFT